MEARKEIRTVSKSHAPLTMCICVCQKHIFDKSNFCRLLVERKKALQRAIEGLGQHGMVGTTDERLMNLHDALKLEFQKVQRTYQDSLEKLDALALVVGKVGKGQVR